LGKAKRLGGGSVEKGAKGGTHFVTYYDEKSHRMGENEKLLRKKLLTGLQPVNTPVMIKQAKGRGG